MSSKLIPPKVGDIDLTEEIKSSMFLASISISNTSIPAKILNKRPFLPSLA